MVASGVISNIVHVHIYVHGGAGSGFWMLILKIIPYHREYKSFWNQKSEQSGMVTK